MINGINQKNIRLYSSVFHGLLAAIVVFVLLSLFIDLYEWAWGVLWCVSVLLACFFGWIFGSWYIPNKTGCWFFKPYIVTPLISFLSAIGAGLILVLVKEFSSTVQRDFDVLSVFLEGAFIGGFAFVIALPVTIIVGMVAALYLYKLGGYKDTL